MPGSKGGFGTVTRGRAAIAADGGTFTIGGEDHRKGKTEEVSLCVIPERIKSDGLKRMLRRAKAGGTTRPPPAPRLR